MILLLALFCGAATQSRPPAFKTLFYPQSPLGKPQGGYLHSDCLIDSIFSPSLCADCSPRAQLPVPLPTHCQLPSSQYRCLVLLLLPRLQVSSLNLSLSESIRRHAKLRHEASSKSSSSGSSMSQIPEQRNSRQNFDTTQQKSKPHYHYHHLQSSYSSILIFISMFAPASPPSGEYGAPVAGPSLEEQQICVDVSSYLPLVWREEQVLYCTVLYCTVLYSTVLYCTVLCRCWCTWGWARCWWGSPSPV